jgi:hypothetical protein
MGEAQRQESAVFVLLFNEFVTHELFSENVTL